MTYARNDFVVMVPGATPRTPEVGRKCKRVNEVKVSSWESESPGCILGTGCCMFAGAGAMVSSAEERAGSESSD